MIKASIQKYTDEQREKQRAYTLSYYYGIAPEEYAAMLESQGGGCYVCYKSPPERSSLCVDHDHKTGIIRGLLCNWCNRIIGMFRDNANRLERAWMYVNHPPAYKIIGKRIVLRKRPHGRKRRRNNAVG